MPTFNTKIPRYDYRGDASRREQIRNADLDRIERNKKFPTFLVKKYGFRPCFSGHDTIYINGPLCPNTLKERLCLSPLQGDSVKTTKAHCDVCGKTYDMPHDFEDFRNIAEKAYEGYQNSGAELINLDIPYEAVKAEAEDKTRWVKVIWSQKDGRNQAIIYFIEKNKEGNKSHIFADFDREEIRYDVDDIPPGKILSKIKAYFKGTEVDIKYK